MEGELPSLDVLLPVACMAGLNSPVVVGVLRVSRRGCTTPPSHVIW